ncbi:RTA1-domain-containing protein [Irpex rosettiformis]|uniref:RTA1-domain-containing protein n=1 Tax=Irpex rosettiformis TaxID=378272 RepID=A0ACB8UKK4_9APHY|nr:RTA1-domain-containing protein [Irpex rosettiformis]
MSSNSTSELLESGQHINHLDFSPYNYLPTEWICAIFLALFSLSGLIHLGEAINSRLWFMIPTAVLGNITEVIGWSGRLWSSKNVLLLDPFLMQITTTIIAPTPLVAANFVILGEIIARLGPQYSRLSPMWYTIVFCSCDIIALVIQAVGGAKASMAVQNGRDPGPGGNIMLAGIAFQLAAITIYVALATEFILRFLHNRPVRKVTAGMSSRKYYNRGAKLMLFGLGMSSLFIFIRSVYRTIELANGWTGKIISTQVLFNVLDGAMITLATFTLNFLYPGFLLGKARTWVSQGKKGEQEEHDTLENGFDHQEEIKKKGL